MCLVSPWKILVFVAIVIVKVPSLYSCWFCPYSLFLAWSPALVFSISIHFHTNTRATNMIISHCFLKHLMLFRTWFTPISLNSFPKTTLQVLTFNCSLQLARLYCDHCPCTSSVLLLCSHFSLCLNLVFFVF